MDLYTVLFVLTTFWVGPFWFAMLLQPYADKTARIMNKQWFFLGPIVIWFAVMLFNPNGLIDFVNSGSHAEGFIVGMGAGLSSKAGVTAMWSHMVAGDIFATRWIWRDSIERQNNIWLIRASVFFGVMLMPVGILIHLIFRKSKAIA